MFKIRNATVEDAKPLSCFAEQTFYEAFSDQNTLSDMQLYCSQVYGETQQTAEIMAPHSLTLVVEHETRFVAYAQLRWGPEHAPSCLDAEHPGEIQRFYVEQAYHGRGVAQQLMDACLSALESLGVDVFWLGVWDQNPRALAFYKKLNFTPVGEHHFLLGNDQQRDVILRRLKKD